MEQKFLEEKAAWISKMKRGDMAEAARIAGVRWATMQEWVSINEVGDSMTERRNLKAIKAAVRKRERNLAEAIAA